MDPRWLSKRMTIEEAEAENMVLNDRLGPNPVPFGFSNTEWRRLISQMEIDDELWSFCSPQETWGQMRGAAGIALMRDGKVIGSIVTVLN